MSEADYNYLYGLIRSRESELIDSARLRDLLGMRAIDELAQFYPDSPFLRELSQSYDEAGLERAVAAEHEELRALIDTYAPQQELRDLLLVPRDLYNVKVALRANAREVTDQSLYGPAGTRSVAAIQEAVVGEGPGITSAGDTDAASRALAGILERTLGAYYATGRNGQILELSFDRLTRLYEQRLAASVSPAVGKALGAIADISAAELIVRGQAAGVPWDVARWGLLELPSLADVEELYQTRPEEWSGRLGPFAGLFRSLLARIAEGGEVGATVRGALAEVDATIATWRLFPPSFELSYYYLRKKRADLYNLRLICLGKMKGLPAETIRARVDDSLAAAA